jgi:hypothetical protein
VMKHSRAIEYLEGYDPGELSPTIQEKLDVHVAGCAECSAIRDQAFYFHELMATGEASRTPAGFEAALERVRHRTLAEVRSAAASPTGVIAWLRSLSFRPATAVLASAALLALAFLIQPLSKDSTDLVGVSSVSGPVLRAASTTPDFMVVRNGSEVAIKWAHNSGGHQVRKATAPTAVTSADARVVHGRVWTDSANERIPGKVTYYLVD